MELLNDTIYDSANVGYGIVFAIITTVILLMIVYAIKGGKLISPFCYLIALLLSVFLTFQFSLLFGAITTKEATNDISDTINGYAKLFVLSGDGSTDMEDVATVVEGFQNLVPGLSAEMGQLTLGKVDKRDIGGSLMAPSKSYLNKYIFFRILWSLLFIVVSLVAMLMLSNDRVRSKYRRSHNRGERVASRRSSNGRRYSRRMRRY